MSTAASYCALNFHADVPVWRSVAALEAAWAAVFPTGTAAASLQPLVRAVVVRTLPNAPDKRTREYTGKNAPYFTAEAAAWLADKKAAHVLVDLPSVDREVGRCNRFHNNPILSLLCCMYV